MNGWAWTGWLALAVVGFVAGAALTTPAAPAPHPSRVVSDAVLTQLENTWGATHPTQAGEDTR